MSARNGLLDPVANGALAATVLLMLLRPRRVSRLNGSRQLPQTGSASPRLPRLIRSYTTPRRVNAGRRLLQLVATLAASLPVAALPGLARRRHPDLPASPRRSAGHRLNDGAALLAFSVLGDSAVEHYRGTFHNRAMYAPPLVSALTLAGSLFGSLDPRRSGHGLRDAIYATAAATGCVGFGFHTYNILKRPGQLSWLNLFYAAPIGAPMALALAGMLGRGAERVRDGASTTIFGIPMGRALAAVSAVGLAGTVGEAGLLHFRGAYHNPAMFIPVTLPSIASVLLAAATAAPGRMINALARSWLRLTAIMGLAGVGFHAYGISRNMGGWRNWSQNVLNGPPLPAPPSFTGLALAGLAALSLIEEQRRG